MGGQGNLKKEMRGVHKIGMLLGKFLVQSLVPTYHRFSPLGTEEDPEKWFAIY